ncbi:MAG: DMT family transporter [Verrucomicrobiales bacterium]|nr:DMT family transporter [Verrucomicrobiota bacterium JB025]
MFIGDLYAIGAGLFWSVAVILMRVSGFQIPPLPLNFFKNSVGLACLAVLLLVQGESWLPELGEGAYLRLIASGVLGISIADVMIAAALNRLGASMQALADCAYSPAIAAVGFLAFGETLSTWELFGGALVISGVFVGAAMTTEIKSKRDLWTGIVLAASAHILMAVAVLMIRDIYRESSLVWVTGVRFLIANAGLLVWAALRYGKRMPEKLLVGFRRRDTWITMIPMAFMGTFVATLFWIAGFKYLAAGRAAIYNQLSTVFIILLAYVFLHEKFTLRKSIGTLLAVAGALCVALH